jgi:3'-phosphoadenosine 5'-phosphosulfate (PAPS) 3'-phosphatase
MSQPITINDVRYAVHAALDTAFPDIPIMGEEIKQGLTPPCFFVKLLEPEQNQELGRRFFRYHPFDVHYFAPERRNEDMLDMADRLTEVLQQIEVAGRPVRGTKMRFEIVDEVLHFFVEYNFHVWAERPDDPLMQRLDVEEGLNG